MKTPIFGLLAHLSKIASMCPLIQAMWACLRNFSLFGRVVWSGPWVWTKIGIASCNWRTSVHHPPFLFTFLSTTASCFFSSSSFSSPAYSSSSSSISSSSSSSSRRYVGGPGRHAQAKAWNASGSQGSQSFMKYDLMDNTTSILMLSYDMIHRYHLAS